MGATFPIIVEDWMLGNQGAQSKINLLKHYHIPFTVINDIIHRGTMPTKGAEPLFGLDGILFLIRAEKLTDGDEAVIAELQSIPTNPPSINEGMVSGEDG